MTEPNSSAGVWMRAGDRERMVCVGAIADMYIVQHTKKGYLIWLTTVSTPEVLWMFMLVFDKHITDEEEEEKIEKITDFPIQPRLVGWLVGMRAVWWLDTSNDQICHLLFKAISLVDIVIVRMSECALWNIKVVNVIFYENSEKWPFELNFVRTHCSNLTLNAIYVGTKLSIFSFFFSFHAKRYLRTWGMSSPGEPATEPTHFCLIYQFQIATNSVSVCFFLCSLHLVETTVKQRDIDINNNANENKN